MKTHILLIDDDADELNILIEALDLTGIGYKCTWASSGQHALEQLSYLSPDVVFLDINMPGMDGFTTLARIRSLPDTQKLPVILYSTTITDAYARRALAFGVSHCLQKQYSLESLAHHVSGILLGQVQVINHLVQ